MTDLAQAIVPKSDQLNADDLIAGPRTITITRVTKVSGEQPVSVHFEDDGGKPWKPCKSMLRVLVTVWGRDGNAYAGRSLTIYRDPDVQFGGQKVGGIRISHMSHIAEPQTMPLTVTRARRAPFTVKPLAAQQQKTAPLGAAGAGAPSSQTSIAPAPSSSSAVRYAGAAYDPAKPEALMCAADFSDAEIQQCGKALRALIERAPGAADRRAWLAKNAAALRIIQTRSPKLEAWVREAEPKTPLGGGVEGASADLAGLDAPSSLPEGA